MGGALKQLAAVVRQANQLNVEEVTDRSPDWRARERLFALRRFF